MASSSAGSKIGDIILIVLGLIAAYFVWVWWNSQSAGTATTQTQSFGPSGIYTYGPTGLVNWSAYPQGALQPAYLPPTWALPKQGNNGLFGTPLPIAGTGGSLGNVGGGIGSIQVTGSPILPSGGRA